MQKISTIVLYILAAVSVLLALWFYITVGENAYDTIATDFNLMWAVILFGFALVITLIFSLVYIVTHPSALKNAAISLVAGVVLIGISYFLADNTSLGGKKVVSTFTLQWVGTGLILTYILAAFAILGIIVSGIIRAFK